MDIYVPLDTLQYIATSPWRLNMAVLMMSVLTVLLSADPRLNHFIRELLIASSVERIDGQQTLKALHFYLL